MDVCRLLPVKFTECNIKKVKKIFWWVLVCVVSFGVCSASQSNDRKKLVFDEALPWTSLQSVNDKCIMYIRVMCESMSMSLDPVWSYLSLQGQGNSIGTKKSKRHSSLQIERYHFHLLWPNVAFHECSTWYHYVSNFVNYWMKM